MGCLVCGKKAYFGILKPKGEKQTSTHCKEHKGENMVDVYIPRCDSEGCMKRRSFGIEGETAMRCKDHKEHNMVYMLSRRCDIQGCVKQPSFGFEGMKKTRCKNHVKDGMIDLSNHRRCDFEGCTTQPSFGNVGEKATRCKDHIEDGMVDVVNPRCDFEGCKKHPTFGTPGLKPSRCGTHKSEDMEDITHARCQQCGEVHVNRGTPYCSGCFLGEGSRFRSAHEKSAFQILERLQCSQEIRAVGVNVGVKGVLKVDGNGRHTKGLELDLPIILKDGSLGAIELDGYEHFQPVLRKGKEWDEAETYYRNKVLADLAKDRYLLGNRVRVARIALRKQAHDHLAFERRVKNAVKALDAGESFFVAEEDKPAYRVLLERYDAIDDAPEIPASLRALRSSCTLDDALLVPIKGQPKLRKDFTGAEIAKKRTRHAKDQHSMDQFVTAEKDETKSSSEKRDDFDVDSEPEPEHNAAKKRKMSVKDQASLESSVSGQKKRKASVDRDTDSEPQPKPKPVKHQKSAIKPKAAKKRKEAPSGQPLLADFLKSKKPRVGNVDKSAVASAPIVTPDSEDDASEISFKVGRKKPKNVISSHSESRSQGADSEEKGYESSSSVEL